MLQPAEDPESGLFQYSEPLRRQQNCGDGDGENDDDDLALVETARLFFTNMTRKDYKERF